MATHASALKRNRQSIKRNRRNKARKGAIHELVKAFVASPKTEAEKVLKELQSKIDRAARKGTLHWKTAARKISRLAKTLKSQ